MLAMVRHRLAEIDQISLEEESYNAEWKELSDIEQCLIRVIKIIKDR